MKSDMSKRAEKAKIQDVKFREMPDIVVKVVCRYRAELFFKISRKTKLSRLFNAWTERMETGIVKKGDGAGGKVVTNAGGDEKELDERAKLDAALASNANPTSTTSASLAPSVSSSNSDLTMQFVFTHNGRSVDADQTPEEAGVEEGDEILAVELMDLTEGGAGIDEWDELIEPRRQTLKKNWTDNPKECVVFCFVFCFWVCNLSSIACADHFILDA